MFETVLYFQISQTLIKGYVDLKKSFSLYFRQALISL